ncbi:DUF1294 domain-containing protein [Ornithinibacillus sp. L9]|uniref:DUF1294 domain-containing protein n=1 Tax=Ornithinibacillus caprae TaxID=2678566 RepID=A0A6N8FFT0_9BACI|nr:DUF1294 domain-containing protein [Ornithinibacillus caprae]MUK86897.1 DUF1294 domain-containing protein [Ornithinibacillus caprae]
MYQIDVWLPYILAVNLIGFLFMGVDKRKAKNNQYRLPERTLWGIAILGGAIGSLVGMKVFRHKTKHRSFVIGMPLLIVVHLVLIVYINVFLS